ncbi:hemerythrin domain-containing protein [Terrabacter carboxydivorans]
MNVQPDAVEVDSAVQLALHLDRVRRHRSELRESVAAVDLALEAPIARGGMWRERVRAALAELAHDFDDHVALTESPGGIYDRARHSAPRLSGRVERLLGEHRDLRDAIHGYLAVLEHGGTMADLPIFREELTVLVGRLVRHRQAGGDLVYEAYDVDLGGQG